MRSTNVSANTEVNSTNNLLVAGLAFQLNQATASQKEAHAEFKSLETKEQQWIKEKKQLNMLLKQASSLQDQFNEKINQQDQEIHRLTNEAAKTKVIDPLEVTHQEAQTEIVLDTESALVL